MVKLRYSGPESLLDGFRSKQVDSQLSETSPSGNHDQGDSDVPEAVSSGSEDTDSDTEIGKEPRRKGYISVSS